MAIEVTPPFKEFTDLSGAPLDNGYIYIGTENLNPEVNLINIYWDNAFTIPAANPLRTISGYPSRNGSPGRIFTKAPFSITVKDRSSRLVYSSLSNNEVPQAVTIDTIAALRSTPYSGQSIVSVTGYYTAADDIGVREYYWDAVSIEADNGGTIIQVTGVVTGRWKMKVDGDVNIKWFGAVGDGITNDTVAWLAFKSYCCLNSKTGILNTGTYQVEPFTFGPEASGLRLIGEAYGSYGVQPGTPAGAGVFGTAPSKLRLRTASSQFVTMAGVYDSKFTNISIDGAGIADNLVYFTGVQNNTHIYWEDSEFCGATPITGYTHRYAGTSGGEACVFVHCRLKGSHSGGGAVAAQIYNTNSNAFLGYYQNCLITDAADLVLYEAGSSNLYDCEFYRATSSIITVKNVTQKFIMRNPYNEGSDGIPFFKQLQTTGVSSIGSIHIQNPFINSAGATIILNCQQPVIITGGSMIANIDVTPVATYGLSTNVVTGVGFGTGYGFTGTGTTTNLIHLGCTINNVQMYNNLNLINTTNIKNSGSIFAGIARPDLTNVGVEPTVTGLRFFGLINTAPTTLTRFISNSLGQEIIVYFGDANTTLTTTNFRLAGSVNVTPTAGSTISFIFAGGNVWIETSRMIR